MAFKDRVSDLRIEIVSGKDAASEVASYEDADLAVCSIVGMEGLIPTLKAIESGKTIALATKEALVSAGQIVMDAASGRGVKVLPIDSEHSPYFNDSKGTYSRSEKTDPHRIRRPFLRSQGRVETVTPKEALRHPTWSMGPKVTIDSATLMNKSL